MKRFMKLMSVVLVLGAVATAEDLGGNPEVSVGSNPAIVFGNCDPYMKALGLCRSSNDILGNN